METFSAKYQIFNLPYLFSSVEAYHEAMDDPEVTDPIFKTTSKAGLETVAWLDAGTRNFYTIKTPINQPSDLKGLKIRVQQSPTNVEMMRLLGGTATPMGFGDVYTALQAGILDGAENNELALTDNGHGDICKYCLLYTSGHALNGKGSIHIAEVALVLGRGSVLGAHGLASFWFT